MAGFISHLFAFYTWAMIKLLTSHLPSPHPLYPQLTCCIISWNSSPVHHTLVSSACWTPYCHEPLGPKQQKLVFSQLWRPGPGSGSAGLCCLRRLWEGPSLDVPLPWRSPASGGSWCSVACGCLTADSASVFTVCSLLCVCVASLSVFLLWGGLWSDCPGPPEDSRTISACQDPYHVCKDPVLYRITAIRDYDLASSGGL